MARTRELESTDFLPRLNKEAAPLSYKNLKLTLVSMPVATVDEREFKDVIEAELFLQEEIVIVVHPTNDQNAPPCVPAGCNGEQVWIPRGVKISIPRKFVESLARYETALTTEAVQNPNADDGYVQRSRASQPYPFAVIGEKHPKGAAWLERIMRGG